MNRTNLIKKIGFVTIIAFVGFSAQALADQGMGYGQHHGWGQHMHGWHHGGYSGPGFGNWANLTKEDAQKLEKERVAFFESTEDIRSNLYQKGLELRSELAKKTPDAKKAASLQKEISELKAEFDQKRLAHFFNVRKINPDVGRGYGGYGMMGPGRMGSAMMGRGGHGGGYCPNCPYGGAGGGYGMGPGYQMGPGMMGPGMMGPDWGKGMSPYGPGGDRSQQMGRHMGSLEEKDARQVIENYIKSTGNPNLALGQIKDAGNAFEVEIVTKEKSLVDKVLVDKSSGAMRSAY
jgi:Spy/CpxP family protein refolding chaperone